MPFCPKCKYEYREGIEICPDCDLPLKAKLPKEKEAEHDNESWATLMTSGNQMEVDIIRTVLDSAGIPALVESDVTSTYPTTWVVGRGARLMVPESRLAEARKAIGGALMKGTELE